MLLKELIERVNDFILKIKNMIKATKEFFFKEDMEWEQVDPLLRRQIHGYDDKIMLVIAEFKEGGVGQMHNHHHSQVTYVASGEFEMTIVIQSATSKIGCYEFLNVTTCVVLALLALFFVDSFVVAFSLQQWIRIFCRG